VYIVAASADGDQQATFRVGDKAFDLLIQNWGGFIGQWDDRQWSSKDTSHDDYGDMIGLRPSYIKRADLAWYCNHHHNAAGENVPYAYSYLFGYAIDLPSGTKTIKLLDNNKVRILAMSVANENPEVKPAQPLYDVLPSPNAGPGDFTLSASSTSVSIPQGRSVTTRIIVMPRGSFNGSVSLNASGLPQGVTASFSPASTAGASTMTLNAAVSAPPTTTTAAVVVTAASDGLSRTITTGVTVTPVATGTVPVDLSSVYNVTGIYNDGSTFAAEASLDGDGYSFSEELLGSEQIGDGVVFKLGLPNVPDAVTGKTIPLPGGKFTSIKVLAVGVNGPQELQTFTVTYADGTSSSFTQSLSDWAVPRNFAGESQAVSIPYRLTGDGSRDTRTFYADAYSLRLDSQKVVRSLSLPSNRDVLVLAVTLVPAAN
jgi:alpha-mannosidase